ncbi:MAG: hypothetical protein ABI318_16925 [Chthoniobacteraceae bacterium]
MPDHEPHRHHSREDWVCHIFASGSPLYAHVFGTVAKVEMEITESPDRPDHVLITLDVPPCGTVMISVNTCSRANRIAGFDPRVSVAVVKTSYAGMPEPFIEEATGLDYATVEAQFHPRWESHEHETLSSLLMERARVALRVEAWGEIYRKEHLGLHQIHSRRASCAVKTDLIGHDGALRFYLHEGHAEMFLFKFCGQA